MVSRLDLTKEGLVITEKRTLILKGEYMVDPSREGLVLYDPVLPLEPGAWVDVSSDEDFRCQEGNGVAFDLNRHLIPIKKLQHIGETHLRSSPGEVVKQKYRVLVVSVKPSRIRCFLEAFRGTNGVLSVYDPCLAASRWSKQ